MNCDKIIYPASVVWEINTLCNHKCTYCYNYKADECSQQLFDNREQADKTVKFIIEHKPLYIAISGGEPLLAFSEIKRHIEAFVSNGIIVSLYTNATVVTEEMAKFFSDNNIRLMVSFPSCIKQEFEEIVNNSHTFEKVISAMDILNKYKVNFQPNIVATKVNYNSIEQTVKFLWERYAPQKIFVSRTTRPSNAGQEYDSISLDRSELNSIFNLCVELSEKYNINLRSCGGFAMCAFDTDESRKMFSKCCDFGINSYVVTTEGDVRVCAREGKTYGNIFADDFEKIRKSMCEWIDKPVPAECKGCVYMERCRGGCRMASRDANAVMPTEIDCDANIGLREKLTVPKTARHFILPQQRFSVSEISVVEDKKYCRVSHLSVYAYTDKKIADFLLKNKRFTFFDFCRKNHISFLDAEKLLSILLRKGIVARVKRDL